MYRPRWLASALSQALESFPAVIVTGPRQSGKTTFVVQELGTGAEYVTFDDPLNRRFAQDDPKGFVAQFGHKRVILDEVQYAAGLLPLLKIDIDRNRGRMGRWILTGSQQFQLMRNVSESLAGRIAVLELLPFTLLELSDPPPRLDAAVWTGLYPSPSLDAKSRDLWMRAYVATYVERDVRQLQNVQNLDLFEKFMGVLAARHSQVFNSSEIARVCGVSLPTVRMWTGVLRASYLCVFLPPYSRNYGKRLLKSPKAYFLDPGVVCYMTLQPSGAAALAGPLGGSLFEGLIVAEANKVFSALGKKPALSYWRSKDGLEVDLLIQIGARLHAVEIKLTATPTPRHCEPLSRFIKLAGSDAEPSGTLVCRVDRPLALPGGHRALPWQEFSNWLRGRLEAE